MEPAGHGAGPRGARAPGGVLESPLCWGRGGFISALLPPPQVFQDYGFHPLVQRWIIGQCLCVDERTVSSYGIRRDGDTAFLYLLSAKRAELTRQRYEEDQAQLLLNSIAALGDGAAAGEQRQYNTLPSASPRKGPGAAPVPSAGGQEGQPGFCPDPAQILPKPSLILNPILNPPCLHVACGLLVPDRVGGRLWGTGVTSAPMWSSRAPNGEFGALLAPGPRSDLAVPVLRG